MKVDCYFINVMEDYLKKIGKLDSPTQEQLGKRAKIEPISDKNKILETHVKYMIYAQLSNQERYRIIEQNIERIDEFFFQYDIKKIKEKSGDYFYKKIKDLNILRGLSLKNQMRDLHYNVCILESINNKEDEKGGLNSYIFAKSPRENILDFITTHKLKNMGISLICEYLKNIGVECANPDTHVMRFLSKTRRGLLNKNETYVSTKGKNEGNIVDTQWSDNDKMNALEIIENMEKISGKKASDIDRIIWCYCADGKGEICTKTPRCDCCVVKNGCNYSWQCNGN